MPQFVKKNLKKPNFVGKKFTQAIIILLVFAGGFYGGTQKDSLVQRIRYGNDNGNSGLAANLDYSGVEEIYSQLKTSFDGSLDSTKLEDGLKQGLVAASGDPYTEYFNAEASKEFEGSLNGSFEGIGAELGKENQSIVIIAPIAGFPAEKAGLLAGDSIVKINDENAFDLTVGQAVDKIRGTKGTKVKLTIIRKDKQLDFEITRDMITIPSVKTEVVEGNIGIIKISRFGDDTTQLTRAAAIELKSKNVKGIILDLRSNPGGKLDSSVEVSSLWLPKGTKILEEKRGQETVQTYGATGDSVLLGIPTVVLIDGGSASASEIVAGALHDNGVATLSGVKSYGKGSVQEVQPLKAGGALKVTIARWFTPKGINIDKEGITPDQVVDRTPEDITAKRDPQQDAALAKLR